MSQVKQDLADSIAKHCYDRYDGLPKKGKPQIGKEWMLLAGIVKETKRRDSCSDFEVVALGTGTKCLGESKMSRTGDMINDSHAEIIARRAFMKYLLYHIEGFYETGSSEIFKIDDETFKFSIKDGTEFHFFTSYTPCGDASIFPQKTLEGSAVSVFPNDNIDSSTVGNGTLALTKDATDGSGGASGFQEKAIMNSRPSYETGGKRVGDEKDYSNLAKKQNTGTYSVETQTQNVSHVKSHLNDNLDVEKDEPSVLVRDIHRTGAKCVSTEEGDPLVPGADYHRIGLLRTKPGRGERTLSMCCSDKLAKWNVVGCQGSLLSHLILPVYFTSFVIGSCPFSEAALRRALILRCSEVSSLHLPYKLHSPLILQSKLEFQYCKHKTEAANDKAIPSNTSVIWYNIPCQAVEVAVNGKKQGVTAKNIYKPLARCSICKAEFFKKFMKVIQMPDKDNLPKTLRCQLLKTYHDFKQASLDYQLAWQQLLKVFKDWKRAPTELEQFTLEDVS